MALGKGLDAIFGDNVDQVLEEINNGEREVEGKRLKARTNFRIQSMVYGSILRMAIVKNLGILRNEEISLGSILNNYKYAVSSRKKIKKLEKL